MGDVTKKEPAPKPGGRNVLDYVIDDLIKRSDFGLKKYGTRLQTNNGRDALMDAYQEVLDAIMYIKQELIQRDGFPVMGKIDDQPFPGPPSLPDIHVARYAATIETYVQWSPDDFERLIRIKEVSNETSVEELVDWQKRMFTQNKKVQAGECLMTIKITGME